MTDTCHEAVGAVHLHSKYSDGSRDIGEIAKIAKSKNLDFLMFSDHNTLEPKRMGMEGWYDDVLVIIGCELNDPDDRNHFLAFRIDEEIPEGLEAAAYVKKVKALNGFGVIAHPAEKRSFSDAYPPYPWTAWDVEAFDGIEIWNQLSEWMEGVTKRNIWWRIMHPLRSIRFPVWEILERWDQYNKKRRIVGIGGIDVHGFRIKLFGLIPRTIYPYKVQFRSIRTHVLTKQILHGSGQNLSFKEGEESLFEGLIAGRCFVSNHSLGDARGFRFHAVRKEGVVLQMGDRVRKGDELILAVTSPLDGDIRLLRDGKMIARSHGKELHCAVSSEGVYRVEIFKKRRGWIYSNPIVVES